MDGVGVRRRLEGREGEVAGDEEVLVWDGGVCDAGDAGGVGEGVQAFGGAVGG